MFTTQNGCMPERSGGAKGLLAICPFFRRKRPLSPWYSRSDSVKLIKLRLVNAAFSSPTPDGPHPPEHLTEERGKPILTYHILYNPHAGSGRGQEAAYRLNVLLPDDRLLFRDITEIDDYGAIFRSLRDDDRVVIAGGDGTLNRFINDTAQFQIGCHICYFATGSGNDFLTDIGGKAGDPPQPIDRYLQGLPSVYVNGMRRYFLNGVGYGIDGYCCLEGDRQREISTRPVDYAAIAVKGLLFHYKPTSAVITTESPDGIPVHFQR